MLGAEGFLWTEHLIFECGKNYQSYQLLSSTFMATTLFLKEKQIDDIYQHIVIDSR